MRAGPQVQLPVDLPEPRELVERIAEINPSRGICGGWGWANHAASYFNDCAAFCQAVRRVMRSGALAAVVTGNNILQGVEVPTDRLFAAIAQNAGLDLVAMEQVRRKRVGSSIIRPSVRAGAAGRKMRLHETAIILRAL